MHEESINGQMLSGLENPELEMKANVITLFKSKIQLTPNMNW